MNSLGLPPNLLSWGRRVAGRWALAAFAASVLLPGAQAPAAATTESPSDGPVIRVLSSRADTVTGDDALVEIVMPDDALLSTALDVQVEGRDVSSSFAPGQGGRRIGLLTGLRLGLNLLTARLADGREARLTLRNHPIGGPVFSGPQVTPWICGTEEAGLGAPQDEQCNAPARVELLYKNGRGEFAPYDPSAPPSDVLTTTTDRGHVVPYIVRLETGTLNRSLYRFAVLVDPSRPVDPTNPHEAWNQKVYYVFGGSVSPNHVQGSETEDVFRVNIQGELPLSRGFAVAAASLTRFGQNSNTITSAETVMMVKEEISERLGEIRYTIGRGESGGSIQMHLIAESYPGILDGIIASLSFPDMWANTGMFVADCSLLNAYFTRTSPHLWPNPQQRAAVDGHLSASSCLSVDPVLAAGDAYYDPRISCTQPLESINPLTAGSLGLSDRPEYIQGEEPDWVYDPEVNPGGARCTVQDYQSSLFGPRPPAAWTDIERQLGRGFANRPIDNVGLQYGLEALESLEILPEQFVDLNEKIGGADIDWSWTPERIEADPLGLSRAYRSGQVNSGRQVARVPIIDLRPVMHGEFHNPYNSWSMRQRLIQAVGHADNQVIWLSKAADSGTKDGAHYVDAFLLMDDWVAAIEADGSGLSPEEKVRNHRPAEAVDACWIEGTKLTDMAACRVAYPGGFDEYGQARMVAGGPLANDILKCALKPLDRSDYPVPFTDDQWARLEAAFPRGVCDWSKPGVGVEPSVPWLSYEEGPGGKPLSVLPEPGALPTALAAIAALAWLHSRRTPRLT